MKKFKLVPFISIVLAFSVQISAAEKIESSHILENNAELKNLIEIVNEEHRSVEKPVVNFEEYIENFSVDESEFVKYEEITNNFYPDAVVDKSKVSEDIDILFKILETSYGGYYYFGGDKAFAEAKEAILNDVSENITGQQLEASIRKNLSIIKDSHFTINNRPSYDYFIADMYVGADFTKDGENFLNSSTGKKVVSIEGHTDWKELFKRFISETGDLVYRPVILTDQAGDKTLTVVYEDDTTQVLNRSDKNSGFEFVSSSGFGDIPVIRCQYTMGFDKANQDNGAKLFLEYAEEYKNEPILIVDIRNNGGGNGLLPVKWFMEYAGEFVPNNYSSLKYMTDEWLKMSAENKDSQYYIPYEELTGVAGFTPISENYMKANAQPDKFVDNDNLLIILTNKSTASSSESFVDIAHNLKNTLIVGTNTGGVLIGDAFARIYLPNSGIAVQFGAGIGFFPENHFEEYKGFEPDIWVDGNAEEMIYKFLYNFTD